MSASTGSYLIARTGQNTFTALTAACTHDGCAVSGFAGGVYVCPCHGAEFNTSGGVTQGPAVSALRQFRTTFANNVVNDRRVGVERSLRVV